MIQQQNLETGKGKQNIVEITRWKNNAAAALTLSFDDGYKETVENCAGYLSRHNIRATFNIPTALIGSSFEGRDVVSWSDIYDMAQQADAEIASHSVNHLDSYISPLEYLSRIPAGFYYASSKLAYIRRVIATTTELLTRRQSTNGSNGTSLSEIECEVTDSKSEIDKHITLQTTSSYVYPYGKRNKHYKDCISSAGYVSARGTLKGYNVYKTVDFLDLRCMLWSKNTTVEEADDWINKAMTMGAWLIETYHLVSKGNHSTYEWSTSTESFQQHINYISNLINSNKVWVDTQQNVAKYMKQRLSSEVKVLHQDPLRYLLSLHNRLAPIYDQELTLRVEIPHQWHKVEISQGDRPIAARKENDNILFNALPNKGDIRIESAK